MQKIDNEQNMDLYVSVPPMGENYFNLLVDVLMSLPEEDRKEIVKNVQFEFLGLRDSNGATFVVRGNRNIVIVFVIPPGRPFLKVVAHELAHFLLGHGELVRDSGKTGSLSKFKCNARPSPELEAKAEAKAECIIHSYNKNKDKISYCQYEFQINTQVCCLKQTNRISRQRAPRTTSEER